MSVAWSPLTAGLFGVAAATMVGHWLGSVLLLVALVAARRPLSFSAAVIGWLAVPTVVALITVGRSDFGLENRAFYCVAALAAFAANVAPLLGLVACRAWQWIGRVFVLAAPLVPVYGDFTPFAPVVQVAVLWQGLGYSAFILALLVVAITAPATIAKPFARCGTVLAAVIALVCTFTSPVTRNDVETAIAVQVTAGPVAERSHLDTQYSLIADVADALQEHPRVLAAEASLGVLQPATALRLARLADSMTQRQMAFVGALAVDDATGLAMNGYVVLSGAKRTADFVPARVSMPSPTGTVKLAFRVDRTSPHDGTVGTRPGPVVMVCLEEILATSLWTLQGRDDVVVLANHWWDGWGVLSTLQKRYGTLWPKIMGLVLDRADIPGGGR